MDNKVIYDFGMNNGDNIEYYIKKGYKVVGVEANPELVKHCTQRFKTQIDEGCLIIENVAISSKTSSEPIDFYVNNFADIVSSIIKPENLQDYKTISVSQKSAAEIIDKHGEAHYLKLDLELYDTQVLRSLLDTDIRPLYISAESHELEVFACLCLLGYEFFNLVDGGTVATRYRNAAIETEKGSEFFSFPRHSAGPFGEDISTPWMPKVLFAQFLAQSGLGWKDIHATNVLPAKANLIQSMDEIPLSPRQNLTQMKMGVKAAVNFIPSLIRRFTNLR